ncbi:DUF2470 domain-containing protein [Streptomyces sp. NPDC060194]|uniref:DUF2470 domain-containing protein n=1 Tax=Streptomyces sp. NPDC060194 TaxID=3347069 RepID=UPI00364F34B3
MSVRQPCPGAPTAAEHVRSVLASAWACAVTMDGCREDLVGAHGVTAGGALRLQVPADSVVAAGALVAPRGEPSVLLEFADVSPVAVRDRVRARVFLSGWLAPDGDGLVLRPARAVLRTAAGPVCVDLDELAEALPDPLADAEAGLLMHLADSHGDAVEQLTRLVDPDSLQGVVRVTPLALDRYGLTLRLERLRGHGDVRLAFAEPVADASQVPLRMHQLLASASRAARRRPYRTSLIPPV